MKLSINDVKAHILKYKKALFFLIGLYFIIFTYESFLLNRIESQLALLLDRDVKAESLSISVLKKSIVIKNLSIDSSKDNSYYLITANDLVLPISFSKLFLGKIISNEARINKMSLFKEKKHAWWKSKFNESENHLKKPEVDIFLALFLAHTGDYIDYLYKTHEEDLRASLYFENYQKAVLNGVKGWEKRYTKVLNDKDFSKITSDLESKNASNKKLLDKLNRSLVFYLDLQKQLSDEYQRYLEAKRDYSSFISNDITVLLGVHNHISINIRDLIGQSLYYKLFLETSESIAKIFKNIKNESKNHNHWLQIDEMQIDSKSNPKDLNYINAKGRVVNFQIPISSQDKEVFFLLEGDAKHIGVERFSFTWRIDTQGNEQNFNLSYSNSQPRTFLLKDSGLLKFEVESSEQDVNLRIGTRSDLLLIDIDWNLIGNSYNIVSDNTNLKNLIENQVYGVSTDTISLKHLMGSEQNEVYFQSNIINSLTTNAFTDILKADRWNLEINDYVSKIHQKNRFEMDRLTEDLYKKWTVLLQDRINLLQENLK